MTLSQVGDWLTGTIPGVVMLGATGSLLAIPLARVLRLGFWLAFDFFTLSNVRPFIASRLLIRRFQSEGNQLKLGAYIAGQTAIAAASMAVFLVLLLLSATYFAAYGLSNVRLTVAIALMLGLCLGMTTRDMAGMLGIHRELIDEDEKLVDAQLRHELRDHLRSKRTRSSQSGL